MILFASTSQLHQAVSGKLRLLKLSLLALASSLISMPASAQGPNEKPDPDTMLIEVYKELAANHLRQAKAKADKLVEMYPTFRLGHLIRGDLLLMHARPVPSFGAASNAPPDKLKDLRHEAMVRLNSLRWRPDPDLIPRVLMQLRDDQRFALVVDTKLSRLYVYENLGNRIKFISDYYVTQGKLGVNKFKEGDQKTPLGVYYITSRLPKAKLPDLYGSGAMPINYPNDWDKMRGRGGSGIWVHGTPSDSYSRPPLASDGCVVLTNPDWEKLSSTVEIGKTPIIISDKIEFINKTKWEAERDAANQLLNSWRRDIESMDPAQVLNNYSRVFKSGQGEDINSWHANYRQSLSGVSNISVRLKDMSFFRYPASEEMFVTTFTQDTAVDRIHSSQRKRQYWVKENNRWKIVYEVNI